MSTTSDISKDVVIRWKDDLYLVVEFQHVNPGKGSAFVRTRLKNIGTGKVFENTFKSGEGIEIVEVERRRMQYLYGDPSGFYFMDGASYEQVTVPRAMLEERAGYLREGQEASVITYQGQAVTVEFPKKITLTVTEAAPGVKGDTAGGNVTKEATLETGMKIRVPLFIKEGEKIIINTETGEYVERA
ncbi:elongation factor P [Candidatus Uhrbacteria bacterium RIFCSPHIGHO2_02_FULL_57_19]|uniref:Elongation factor P n=1 Tax=Candidatus Uhrbacteria bacterium RIFCSPHIGHO2_02_FULL_57_19 TaxID=1802391 RepID=A0A1F7U524_9BACT|nr:MAG: elongation factor P [Candidatus Uhrbacteria bacterium RIFCSPHIGHO2_02_FULL_57_19]